MSPNSCFPNSCFPLSWFQTLHAARASAGLSSSVFEFWDSSWFISPLLFIVFGIVFATIYFLLGGLGFPWVAVWTVLSRRTWSPRSGESNKKRHRQRGKVIPVESVPRVPRPETRECVVVWWWGVSWRVFLFLHFLWSSKSFAPWSAAACAVQTQFIIFWCRLTTKLFFYIHTGSILEAFGQHVLHFCCFLKS